MTVKSNSLLWPFLLGVGGLVLLLCLDGEDHDRKTCSSVSAAVLASNPNLERSLQIESAKKSCIQDRICDPRVWRDSYPCEFTVYDFRECRDIDPALGDYKMAQRHLEAEVQTCELGKTKGRHGETVYQWPGRR
jgi:hypothetical protein